METGQYYPRLVGPSSAPGGTTVLELRGELDILAVSVLSDRLDEITGTQGTDLVVDVRAVTFIDCAGLSLLSRARYRTRQRGGRLRLTGVFGGGSVARLLRMTGLTGSFEILSDETGGDDGGGAAGASGSTAVTDTAAVTAAVPDTATDAAGTAVA
ncbi:anti-anti-sigma factor [Streptomyces sp. 2224.1]|uniref:STAS domain-containing protein n=1 Tax=Streptomyces sp. 2224.1 TaxID=1881020 RepID=UPI0008998E76|nr:STAS domain-containing protein [Streptomyces sp. 2224.1]SED34724.1 anti-anti-sigma factor [Streptomyces sp. 2224.1]